MTFGSLLVMVACKNSEPGDKPGTGSGSTRFDARTQEPGAPEGCARLPFPETVDVPEASGAVLLDGRLWIVGDSGNNGAYVAIDPDTGVVGERGQLPLGGGRDDLEGLAVRGGQLIAISSAGWIRRYRRTDGAFALVGAPTPLTGQDAACPKEIVNCGPNYEGICLGDGPGDGTTCIGMVVSKRDGALRCVTDSGTQLAVDGTRAITGFSRETLTGCDLAPDGSLWLGANLFAGNSVWRIDGWATPAQARTVLIGPVGDGFAEAITAGANGTVYRFGDNGRTPSQLSKFRCPTATAK